MTIIWLTIGFLCILYLNATTDHSSPLAYLAMVLGPLLLPFVARRCLGRWMVRGMAHF